MKLLIVTAIVFVFYVALVTIKFKYRNLTSISASSYLWQGKQRWIFVGWLAALAVLVYQQPLGGFSLYAALGLFGAGLTFEHKRDPEKLEDDAHTFFTIVGIASIFLSLIFVHGIWSPAVALVVLAAASYFIDRSHFIYLLENSAMICAVYGLAKVHLQ